MEKFKKITSFVFLVIIFTNHIFSLFHAFEHKHTSTNETSEIIKFSQDSDTTKGCFYCNTYLSLDYVHKESVVYSLIVPTSISDIILTREKQLVSTLVSRKKSRSPPSQHS